MYRLRECGLTRSYAPRRGGSKTAPLRTLTLTLLAAAAIDLLASAAIAVITATATASAAILMLRKGARACSRAGTSPVVVVGRPFLLLLLLSILLNGSHAGAALRSPGAPSRAPT